MKSLSRHRLGRKALEELAAVAKPDTLLAWYRKLIATKFDGSKFRKSWGRPRVDEETERLVVRMACGSAYAKRVDYLLRAVFHSFGEPEEDMLGRSHTSSGSRVDGTDGAQCDDGRCWFSDQLQVPTA